MADVLTIDRANFAGKRVLVRVDFNVPMDGSKVRDDTRIRASLPTIEKLRKDGAQVILCSHLGRPKGGRAPEFTLRPAADRLAELLEDNVEFADDCVGPDAEAAVEALMPGQVLVLENLRFHKEEEANDPTFAQGLASLADAYVNDAFGSAHRAHASTAGVTAFLPSYAGHLLQKELRFLGGLLENPARPYVAVLGGAKVSGKIDVLENLLPRVDAILIGGAMAFTFSRALGGRTGDSLVEPDKVELARRILDDAQTHKVDLVLPVDVVVAHELKGSGASRVVPFMEVPDGMKGLDIGPETVRRFSERIVSAKTVLLNGPMGVFEQPPFDKGTMEVFRAVADCAGTTVAGGGDTAAAVEAAGVRDQLTHVSTGGGASLEFLEGKTLPGVAALKRALPAR